MNAAALANRAGKASATSAASHRKLDLLERAIVSRCAPIELHIEHHFSPGMYAREMRAPAGAVIVSRTHKTEHLFVLSKGRLRVWVDDRAFELEAPFTGRTLPGTRRAAVVLEDCIWTTFHPTNLTDVDAIDREILEPHNNEELLGLSSELQGAKPCHGLL